MMQICNWNGENGIRSMKFMWTSIYKQLILDFWFIRSYSNLWHSLPVPLPHLQRKLIKWKATAFLGVLTLVMLVFSNAYGLWPHICGASMTRVNLSLSLLPSTYRLVRIQKEPKYHKRNSMRTMTFCLFSSFVTNGKSMYLSKYKAPSRFLADIGYKICNNIVFCFMGLRFLVVIRAT